MINVLNCLIKISIEVIPEIFDLTQILKFGSIIEPLFCTFEDMVTTSNVDQFRHSIIRWLTEHCSLIILRPSKFEISNILRIIA